MKSFINFIIPVILVPRYSREIVDFYFSKTSAQGCLVQGRKLCERLGIILEGHFWLSSQGLLFALPRDHS